MSVSASAFNPSGLLNIVRSLKMLRRWQSVLLCFFLFFFSTPDSQQEEQKKRLRIRTQTN